MRRKRAKKSDHGLVHAKGHPKVDLYTEGALGGEEALVVGLAMRQKRKTIAKKTGMSYAWVGQQQKRAYIQHKVAELRLEFLNRVKQELIQHGRFGARGLHDLALSAEDDKVRYLCLKALADLGHEVTTAEGLMHQVVDLTAKLEEQEGAISPASVDSETLVEIIRKTSFRRKQHGTAAPANNVDGRGVEEGGPELAPEAEWSDTDSSVRERPAGEGGLDGAGAGECPPETREELLPPPAVPGAVPE